MARGRRVNSSGEKSKKLLLEKAIELFSMHGYHQTKISDIVKAANLTQPTFYLYFQSKETLFHDLNEKFRQDLTEICTTITYEHSSPSVQEILKSIFCYFEENPSLTKIGFYETEHSEAVKQMLSTKFIQIIEHNSAEHPVMKHVAPSVLAESLIGSMERLTVTNLLTHQSTPEKLAEEISMIYFAQQQQLVHQ